MTTEGVSEQLNAAGEPILMTERDGGMFTVRMNRPERLNALGGGLPEALAESLLEFRDDPDLKVMILTGTGERAFCVGADLRANDERARELGARSAQALLDATRRAGMAPSLMSNNMHLYKPVIAVLNGWTLAGGCEIAMGCDIRVIESHAQMGLPEAKRGMGAKSTTHKLHFLVPLSVGFDIVWTGDTIPAARAVEMGFANEEVPTGQGMARAKEIAAAMCRWPGDYLRYHKERAFESLGVPLAYALHTRQRHAPGSEG